MEPTTTQAATSIAALFSQRLDYLFVLLFVAGAGWMFMRLGNRLINTTHKSVDVLQEALKQFPASIEKVVQESAKDNKDLADKLEKLTDVVAEIKEGFARSQEKFNRLDALETQYKENATRVGSRLEKLEEETRENRHGLRGLKQTIAMRHEEK